MPDENATSQPEVTAMEDADAIIGLDGTGWVQIPTNLMRQTFQKVLTKTADYTLTAAESGSLVTNRGATADIIITLPAATVGLEFRFAVRASYKIKVLPNTTQLLESTATPAVASTSGQHIWADAVAETLHLVCIETGKWAVQNSRGTWTVAS